jgi:hypothetical protein
MLAARGASAMSETLEFEGGCLCGALRYRGRTETIDAGYCHCRLCQRTSGAPVLAWLTIPIDDFAYLKGGPATFRSSSHGQREFCRRCGTQLLYRETDAATSVDVNLATLDHPETIEPKVHIWTDSRIPWFDVADDLPRHGDAGPERSV